MNRLFTALLAGGALMSSGLVLAADQATQNRDTQTQAQPNAAKGTGETNAKGTPGEPNAKSPANEQRPGVNSSNENPASPRDPNSVYSKNLKKCDSMQGAKKQECIAAAKKKSGEM